MSNYQTGSNNGVTGLVSITGLTAFTAAVFGFNRDITAQTQNFPGRGDDEWGDYRLTSTGGVLIISGFAKPEKGFAIPDSFKGVTGTIDLQYSSTSGGTITKETVEVLVYNHKVGTRKNETDEWPVTIACTITAHPTEANFHGDQITPTYPTYTDKILYDGILKRYDPNNLTDGATQAYLLWGVTDSDAAEKSKMLTVLGTALDPLARALKVRDVSLGRINWTACRATVTWGLTSTKDDVLLPRNTFTNDPGLIQSLAHTAAINASAPAPSPFADAFVLRTRNSVKLHDGATLNDADWGLRTTQEDITFPETWVNPDPSDLQSTWSQTFVIPAGTNPPAPTVPAGQRLRTSKVIQINQLETGVFYTGAKDSTKEEVEQANTFLFEDDRGLTSKIQESLVDGTPSIPGNFFSRGLRTSKVTHDHYLLTHEGGLRTTQDDIEMPRTFAVIDPLGLDSEGKTTRVFDGTGLGPADPPAPSGELQKAFSKVERENQFKSVQEITWDVLNSEQKRGFPRHETVDDPNNIGDLAIRYKFYNSTSTPPTAPDDPPSNNVKLVHYEDRKVTPARSVRWFIYGPKSSRDDAVLAKYETTTDPSGLKSDAIRSYLDGESAPTTPTLGGYTLKSRGSTAIPLSDGLTINRTLTVVVYGLRSTEDDAEMEGTKYVVDQSGNSVTGLARVTIIEADATPDGGVTVSGLVLRDVEKNQIHDGKWEITYVFGVRTHESDIEFDGTEYVVDQSGNVVSGSAKVTVVEADATPDGGVTVSGLVLRDVEKKQIHATAWEITYIFGQNTHEDDIELGGTELIDDKSDLKGRANVTIINNSSTTYPVALDTPPTIASETMQLVDVTRKQITSTSGMYAWTGRYALNTNAQEITFGQSVAKSDGATTAIETTTIVTSAASTLAAEEATAFAAAKTDAEFAGLTIKQETPSKYVKRIETVKDDKTFHSERINSYIASTKARPQAGFEVTASFGNTAAFVHAIVEGQPIAPPGGYTSAVLVPIEKDRTVGGFSLRRRYSLTIAQLATAQATWDAIRYKVNNAYFYHHEAFRVKYIGSTIHEPGLNIGIDATGQRAICVDHEFHYDSWMHFNDQNMPIGECGVWSNPISNSGFGPVSVFDPNALLVWPAADAGNFAALLA